MDENPPTELPIACSLGAGDLERRHAEMSALGRRSLISVDRLDDAPATLRFRNDPQTRAELERLVAAEAECCAFLGMKIEEGESLTLTIEGPAGSEPVVEELVAAFASEALA